MTLIPYVVKQGDYVAKLALRFGFDADTVWQDEKNAGLRNIGRTPQILHPGDILSIPKPKNTSLSLKTGAENQFNAHVARTSVTLTFTDCAGSPLANAKVNYRGLPRSDANDQPTTTDGSGTLVIAVPVGTASFIVELSEKQIVREILVGHMDPVSEPSGQMKRLQHLGYGMSPLIALGERMGLVNLDDPSHLRLQLMAFQLDHGLAASGDATQETCDTLVAKHGC